MNEYVNTCNSWGEKEIVERSNKLLDKAIYIWIIPNVNNSWGQKSDTWSDWDDDIDITNMKIVQVSILDTFIKTKDVTDAYVKIHETLYELEPSNHFKSPHEIAKGAFVEKNRSSMEKLRYIRAIAEIFEFTSHDIKFLIQPKTVKNE